MEQIQPAWKQVIDNMETCPQRQDSTMDQLIDLHYVAVKLGFYDAADAIKLTFIDDLHNKNRISEITQGKICGHYITSDILH